MRKILYVNTLFFEAYLLNKKGEMGISINSTNLDIFGITKGWAQCDINDDELHITGFNMFQKYKMGGKKTKWGRRITDLF